MKRTLSLFAALALAGSITSAKFQELDFDFNENEKETENKTNDKTVTNTNSIENQENKAKEQNVAYKNQENEHFDHEKEFRRAKKMYNECGERRGRVQAKGEGVIKTDLDKFAAKEDCIVTKENIGNCNKIRKGNKYCEEVEEKAEICSDKNKEQGERVKANKVIKKRRNNNGFNEKEGNAHNVKLVNGKGRDWKKQNLKKCGEASRCGRNENEANTYVNVAKKQREVEIEDKVDKSKSFNEERQKKENEEYDNKITNQNQVQEREEEDNVNERNFDTNSSIGFGRRD